MAIYATTLARDVVCSILLAATAAGDGTTAPLKAPTMVDSKVTLRATIVAGVVLRGGAVL